MDLEVKIGRVQGGSMRIDVSTFDPIDMGLEETLNWFADVYPGMREGRNLEIYRNDGLGGWEGVEIGGAPWAEVWEVADQADQLGDDGPAFLAWLAERQSCKVVGVLSTLGCRGTAAREVIVDQFRQVYRGTFNDLEAWGHDLLNEHDREWPGLVGHIDYEGYARQVAMDHDLYHLSYGRYGIFSKS